MLNTTSGLPDRICLEWQRKSYQNFPTELIAYSNPKSRSAADAAAIVLIEYLKNELKIGNTAHKDIDDVAVGEWIRKFTAVETSLRTDINASENRPYSADTVDNYLVYYNLHIKDDPFMRLKMREVDEEDALAFNRRMSLKKLADGRAMGGTRTFLGVIGFV
jgi:hypothetical protein